MRVKEIGKKEIEQKFGEMNDYLKMEYLRSCLKNQLDFETRKFVLVKLAGLYEAKGMLLEAGKMMRFAAEINTNVEIKIGDFIKSVELFVRGGDYDSADVAAKKAISANENKKEEIIGRVKEFYRIQAKIYVGENRRKQAIGAYEKLLSLETDSGEIKVMQEKLLKLYEGVGDFVKYKNLKRKI
jgi:tetratricopeptide (TPR) repeat protein